jgi:CRP-like cAMP-binding protein
MYDVLVKYLNGFTTIPLKRWEIDLIQNVFKPKKFRKRQYFLQEGEVCKSTAFIAKGAMRKYRVGDKGDEHVIRLYLETFWVSDRESLMREIPSNYAIDAWEDTECLIVTKADLTDLVDRFPTMTKWILTLDTNYAIAAQKRIEAAISLSSGERIQHFEENHPEFLQRFPQHVIASYLGINRETLSRIRSRYIKK